MTKSELFIALVYGLRPAKDECPQIYTGGKDSKIYSLPCFQFFRKEELETLILAVTKRRLVVKPALLFNSVMDSDRDYRVKTLEELIRIRTATPKKVTEDDGSVDWLPIHH